MKAVIHILIIVTMATNSFAHIAYVNESGSIDELNAELRRDLLDYKNLINEGIEKDNNEDYKGAIEIYSQAIDLLPDNPEAYDRRGISYLKLLNFRKAFRDFDKALELNPNYAEVYNHRGIANICLNQPMLAINDYTRAIELNENYAKAYYNRGLVYIALDLMDMAYKDLKVAYDLGYIEAASVIDEYCRDEANDFASN